MSGTHQYPACPPLRRKLPQAGAGPATEWAAAKPHIHATYPLERAAEALGEVANKRVSGKVVLTT